ncbi:hypothetical protein Ciccas_014580, partial [Cichlidogyrus casuarinus]
SFEHAFGQPNCFLKNPDLLNETQLSFVEKLPQTKRHKLVLVFSQEMNELKGLSEWLTERIVFIPTESRRNRSLLQTCSDLVKGQRNTRISINSHIISVFRRLSLALDNRIRGNAFYCKSREFAIFLQSLQSQLDVEWQPIKMDTLPGIIRKCLLWHTKSCRVLDRDFWPSVDQLRCSRVPYMEAKFLNDMKLLKSLLAERWPLDKDLFLKLRASCSSIIFSWLLCRLLTAGRLDVQKMLFLFVMSIS